MIYPVTIVTALALATLLIMVPRKYFIMPFVLAACFLPADQRIIIMDLDFPVLRILVVVGFLRIFVLERHWRVRWNSFDKIVLLWALCGAVVYCVQWFDTRAFIYKCGVLFDIVGLYWIFRKNINSWDSVRLNFKIFAICALLMVALVGWEWTTGQNPFSILGRVGTVVRYTGLVRCQASFPHSILLGLFWATVLPLFVGLAMTGKKRIFYMAAASASILIVFSTASSTSLLSFVLIVSLLPLFRFRRYGRQIVYVLCGSTVVLHLVMKAPVWHLISRVSLFGGSTGWHRFNLIDKAIKHFDEWALLGVQSTAHWGWGLKDVTNQYIAEGVTGGVVTLALFVYLLVMAVRISGSYSLQPVLKQKQLLAWCVCVSILGHCVAFVGVTYFGQIKMLWYMMMAIVAFLKDVTDSRMSVIPSRK